MIYASLAFALNKKFSGYTVFGIIFGFSGIIFGFSGKFWIFWEILDFRE